MRRGSNIRHLPVPRLFHASAFIATKRTDATRRCLKIVNRCIQSRAEGVAAKLPDTQPFGPYSLGQCQCFWCGPMIFIPFHACERKRNFFSSVVWHQKHSGRAVLLCVVQAIGIMYRICQPETTRPRACAGCAAAPGAQVRQSDSR